MCCNCAVPVRETKVPYVYTDMHFSLFLLFLVLKLLRFRITYKYNVCTSCHIHRSLPNMLLYIAPCSHVASGSIWFLQARQIIVAVQCNTCTNVNADLCLPTYAARVSHNNFVSSHSIVAAHIANHCTCVHVYLRCSTSARTCQPPRCNLFVSVAINPAACTSCFSGSDHLSASGSRCRCCGSARATTV